METEVQRFFWIRAEYHDDIRGLELSLHYCDGDTTAWDFTQEHQVKWKVKDIMADIDNWGGFK
jgi:hypothetical protein